MSRVTFKPGCLAQTFKYFGAFIVFSGFMFVYRTDAPIGVFVFAIILAAPFLLIGAWLAGRDRDRAVAEANERAEWALRNAVAAAGRNERLRAALYLRPFEVTGRLLVDNPRPAGILTPDSYGEETVVDVETWLAEELGEEHPMVALGLPGEHVGAGRVFATEAEWRDAVQRLAGAVSIILVIPSANPGTRWELGWLRESGAIDRSVWLMPPRTTAGDLDMAVYWEGTRQALREDGFELPAYDQAGAVFCVDRAGRARDSRELRLHSRRWLRRYLSETGIGTGPPTSVAESRKAPAIAGLASPVADSGGLASPPPVEPEPKRKRLPAVSYVLIAAVFIVASTLLNLGDGGEPGGVSHPGLDALPLLDPRDAGARSAARTASLPGGLRVDLPIGWRAELIAGANGARIQRPALQVLCLIQVPEPLPPEPGLATSFLSEFDAGAAMELNERAGTPDVLDYQESLLGDTASARYSLAETVMASSFVTRGRVILVDGRWAIAECGGPRDARRSDIADIDAILSSMRFEHDG